MKYGISRTSGFNVRIQLPCATLMAWFCAAANPRFAELYITRQRSSNCSRMSRVPSVELLSTTMISRSGPFCCRTDCRHRLMYRPLLYVTIVTVTRSFELMRFGEFSPRRSVMQFPFRGQLRQPLLGYSVADSPPTRAPDAQSLHGRQPI